MRQRIYNPAQLTPEELKASFIARQETLALLLRLLAEQKPDHPCQHVVLVGPRGMGKTTLGLSFLQAVREDADLAVKWQPVPFPEESYEIGDLADFWLAALRHLAQATGEEGWRDRADGLQDERDPERLATYALAALLDFCEEEEKRLILFVENLDIVFSQLNDERQVHALREALMEHSEILLVGSANTVFDAIRSHGEPFYEFFRTVTLRGLERDECRQLLHALADQDGNHDSARLDLEEGRLEAIRRLTGGNPRLLVLACRMLLESPLGHAFEDMERLIDEQTPYFKARIEELPAQARRVFHSLAKAWAPLLTREVAADAKLGSSHASSQLRQLIDKGLVREVRLEGETRSRYEVSDRFYNIYYLLRFSRTGRKRLEHLVDFLHQLFGPVRMRQAYEAALTALRKGALSQTDISDWLNVLARRVAADEEYPGREGWLTGATKLISEMLGQDSPLHRELATAVATERWDQPDIARVFYAGVVDALDGDVVRAEAAFRDVVATMPVAWPAMQVALGFVLYRQSRFADALKAYREAAANGGVESDPFNQLVSSLASCGEASALLELGEADLAADVLTRVPVLDISGDPAQRFVQAQALLALGDAFENQGRRDSAMQAWSCVAELAQSDDPTELKRLHRASILRQGIAQMQAQNWEDGRTHLQAVLDRLPEDLPKHRHDQAAALVGTGFANIQSGQPEDATALLGRLSDHLRPDDPKDLRRSTAQALAMSAVTFCVTGQMEAAEVVARHAVRIDPDCDQGWTALAEALLAQEGRTRLEEAERCARRAVELAPEDQNGLLTLYAVLKRRKKRKAAKALLARVPDAKTNTSERFARRWYQTLIAMIAQGHAARVKRMLVETNATESMEPLWLAARAELGEDLGALPAEVLDAVDEVRRMIEEERSS